MRDSWKTDAALAASGSSDKARSNSPKQSEHSPAVSSKQSLVNLTAPPPHSACPTGANGPCSTNARRAGARKNAPGAKARKRSGPAHDDGGDGGGGSDSDHDASCSSLSDSSDTDDMGELSLVRGMKRLTLRGLEPTEGGSPERYTLDSQLRFHGKSSSFKLISTTREFIQLHRVEVESSSDGRQSNSPADIVLPPPPSSNKREEFWRISPVSPSSPPLASPPRLVPHQSCACLDQEL